MNDKISSRVYNSIIITLIIILVIQLIPISRRTINAISENLLKASEWGLNYGDKGEQPEGNADKKYLEQYNAYYVGEEEEKVIYLTFDAGYENGYTEDLLDTLKKHDVPAAFFLVGHYIRDNEDLVKRMVEEGHIVANHTATHPKMSAISDFEGFKQELEDVEKMYSDLIGEEMPKYYRPPQGKYNETNLEQAKELGYTTVFWSLAYVDWYDDNQPSHHYAYSKLLPRIHPGAIVLLHSNSQTNSEILDELITTWKEEGYTFMSLEYLKEIDF